MFASHVLEHIKDDHRALSVIRRILKVGGIAVLPVSIVGLETIEYDEPNPDECGLVREPGPGYFECYARYFSKIDIYKSSEFGEEYQLYNYADKSVWPTEQMPLRRPILGESHLDYVPVCIA